jgi:probable F420-dependent oxidoreductase
VEGPLAIPVDAELAAEGPGELRAFARAAEDAGIARLWAPELYRSSTIPLALAAEATERIELATGVALAFTRSPFTLALEALDLDELSGARLVLGLGAGARRLNQRWHAAAYDPPVRRMRETVAALRELIAALPAGRRARSEGRLVDVEVVGYRRPHPAPREAVPIWLAAMLPGMSRLAGAVADGLIGHPVVPPSWTAETVLPALREGAERAGRPAPPLAGGLIVACDDADPGGARAAAACTVGFYATVRTYEPIFAAAGFAGRLPAIREAFMTREPARLAAAVGEEMTDAFAAAGSVAAVRRRARAWEGVADRLWATPPHHLQEGALGRWQAGILAALGRPGTPPG